MTLNKLHYSTNAIEQDRDVMKDHIISSS